MLALPSPALQAPQGLGLKVTAQASVVLRRLDPDLPLHLVLQLAEGLLGNFSASLHECASSTAESLLTFPSPPAPLPCLPG